MSICVPLIKNNKSQYFWKFYQEMLGKEINPWGLKFHNSQYSNIPIIQRLVAMALSNIRDVAAKSFLDGKESYLTAKIKISRKPQLFSLERISWRIRQEIRICLQPNLG